MRDLLPMTAPPNGGNCTIRGATRRRHAEGRLLMLQNPPLPLVSCSLTGAGLPGGRHTAPNRGLTDSKLWGLALHGDPCATCLPMTAPPNGGNCTIRGATRRRHAEGRLLMLQNPHHYPWCHGPSPVQDCPAGATPPRGATSPPASGGSCAARGPVRDLPADDCATKWGELHH